MRQERDRIYRTEGVVLSRTDFGEADRILTVYTPNHGKVRLIAKGVRRPTSRMGPHLEYFTRVRLMVAKGRDLDVVTGAETEDAFLAIRTNLDAFGHASHMVEALNRLTEDRQVNAPVYDLLVRSLSLIADGVETFHVTRHFELALLGMAGYRPELYRCVQCQREIEPVVNGWSVRLGGLLCPLCWPADPSARQLSVNAQKYLRTLDRAGLSAAAGLRVEESLAGEIAGALSAHLRHVAERDLASLRILATLKEPAEVRSSFVVRR